jgi:transposase InsO family protein
MIAIARLLMWGLLDCFKSRGRLQAEAVVLRHQLNILYRKAPKRVRPNGLDRAIFVWLYRLFPEIGRAITIIRPETVVRWHRLGFRAWWRWKSRNPGGRPKIDRELRDLIHRMCEENPLWGAPRMHGELLKLGFDVAQSTVSKYILRRLGPPSQGWKTFLRNHADGIASVDFLIVPTLTFRRLFAFVILGLGRRRLLWIGTTTNPTAEWLARQLTEAFPWDTAPAFLIRDNDGSYGEIFTRRLRAMGIRDRPISPRSPWQNGSVERVIGSIRRECLDHMIVLGEGHLTRVLLAYVKYYNATRTHLAIAKDAPDYRQIQRRGTIFSSPVFGGLHHRYVRI